MESSIFRYVLRYSRREQALLLVMTILAFPFLYMSLDLPKTIVNQAIGGRDFPRTVLGYELEQIPFLLLLSGLFLALVFINGGFKYFINVYRGVVGERMLRSAPERPRCGRSIGSFRTSTSSRAARARAASASSAYLNSKSISNNFLTVKTSLKHIK